MECTHFFDSAAHLPLHLPLLAEWLFTCIFPRDAP